MSRDLTFKSEPPIYSRYSRLHSGGGEDAVIDTMEIELDKATSQPDEDGNPTENTVVTPRVRMHELLQRPFSVRSIAINGLFLLAVFYTIYFVRSLLLPLVLALLLSYLLRPIVRGLAKLKIPPLIGGALLLISLFACARLRRFLSRRSGRRLD